MEPFENSNRKSVFSQLQESVAVKLILIGILTLLLLIPSSWIQSIIYEREQRQEEAITDIANKWSGMQLIESPVIQIPYRSYLKSIDNAGKVTFKEAISTLYLLPEVVKIEGKVNPEILHRGIFDAIVYNTQIRLKGSFGELELKKSGINPEMVYWDKAKVIAGISDFKGLQSNPKIRIGDSLYIAEPDFSEENLFDNSLAVQANISSAKSTKINFDIDMELKGSGELNFLHMGKSTSVNITGKWSNPSFTGNFLPEKRNITETQFSSSWKMSNFTRPFPQQWIGNNKQVAQNREKASFGIKFLLPVDQYQKTTRSAKYAILIILLSFISLFFIELLKKVKVNLLQYVLIGAAMIIYYSLLLSFTEQVGFAMAYLIASTSTVILVSSFIGAFLKNRKVALTFAAILSIFYIFIYVIIQLQDLALLFGSLGLFITVASLMYFSVKINAQK